MNTDYDKLNYCTGHRRFLSVSRFWRRKASWNSWNQRCKSCVVW